MQGWPGMGIIQMLQKAGRGIPAGFQQAKELLGMGQRAPMPTPRDSMGRPLAINPATGQPFGSEQEQMQAQQRPPMAGGGL